MPGLVNQTGGGLTAPLNAASIADGSVDNAEFQALDGLTGSALSSSLADGKIFIGGSGGTAAAQTPSGDFTITNLGVGAISPSVVVNADVNASAAIDFSKLATLTSGNLLIGSAGNVPTSTAMSGDIAIIASGATTIQNSTVTNAKMANMANQTIKGNISGGVTTPSDLSATQATAFLNVMTGAGGTGLKGLAPSQVAGDATKFLRGDATWQTVPVGDVSGPAISTDNGFVKFDGTTGKLIKNSAATIADADVGVSAAIALSKLAALSNNIVPVTNGSGVLTSSAVTATTLGFLDATSSIQTQINTKQTRSTLTTKGDLYVATASDTVARQAAGTNHYVLRSNSSVTNGIEYALPLNSSEGIVNLGLATSVAASALTIAVKTSAGSDASSTDPIFVGFRSATATSGTFSMVSITGAQSLVVPSGATLGMRSGIESVIYIYEINNAGTPELAISRAYKWDEALTITTTTIGTGSDSADIFYSTTGRSNVAAKLVGKLIVTLSVAGTWDSAGSALSTLPFNTPAVSGMMVKTTSQNPGTTALTKTVWDSVAAADSGFDPYNICDLTNDRLIASQPGVWIVFISLSLSNFEASTSLQVYLRKNNVSFMRFDVDNAGVGTTRDFAIAVPIDLAFNDYLEIATQSAADASYSVNGNIGLADSQSRFGMYLKA